MATKTMTMKMFLNAVIATEGIAPELKEFAEGRLEKEIAKTEARKTSEKALAKAAEDAALIEAFIGAAKTETPYLAKEVAAVITETTGTEVSTPKVTALMKKAVEGGKVVAGSVSVKGRSSKTYTVIA